MQACERTFVPASSIDYERAVRQHAAYCDALRKLGVEVRTLSVHSELPDCVFIEDTAVVLDEAAVMASMGTRSRQIEPAGIEPVLREHRELHHLSPEATLEGGDVLRVGRTLFVGLSKRTNAAGVAALVAIGNRYGYRTISVPVRGCLHLKTACMALPDDSLVINANWIDEAPLREFARSYVSESEPWAANGLLLNGGLLMAASNLETADRIRNRGFRVDVVDISEFAKAEGGITCLALIVPVSPQHKAAC
jgi:dimethylargininase